MLAVSTDLAARRSAAGGAARWARGTAAQSSMVGGPTSCGPPLVPMIPPAGGLAVAA